MRKLLLLFLLTQSLAGAAAPLNAATQASSIVESNVSSKPEPAPQITPDQYKELSDRLRATEYAVLDGQRKIVDWWISALAILTGIIAFFGGFIPFLMGRKDKELLKIELQNAKNLVASIKTHEKEAKDLTVNLKGFVSGAEVPPEQTKSTQQDAESILNDPTASEVDKLLARAVLASQNKNQGPDTALKALELWNAICIIRGYDASAHFNAGYWAHELFDYSKHPENKKWFDALQYYYNKSLSINQNSHGAAYNWGLALANEALQTFNLTPNESQHLWDQAGEKYALALALKPDDYQTANNWGTALTAQAQALNSTNPLAAQDLWAKAGKKFELALNIKPDDQKAVKNWGVALTHQAIALQANNMYKEAQSAWIEAKGKFALALKIQPNDQDTARNWGFALFKHAEAIQEANPEEAWALWKEAGDKCAIALNIKNDMHDAANIWGKSLIKLYHAGSNINDHKIISLLSNATNLLEKHSAMSREGRDAVAYNLACAYSLQGRAADAVAQLDICIEANKLAPHWRDEKDFEPIRHTPEFLAWVEKNFPETTTAPI